MANKNITEKQTQQRVQVSLFRIVNVGHFLLCNVENLFFSKQQINTLNKKKIMMLFVQIISLVHSLVILLFTNMMQLSKYIMTNKINILTLLVEKNVVGS